AVEVAASAFSSPMPKSTVSDSGLPSAPPDAAGRSPVGAGQTTGTENSGGVNSLSSTSSHSPWASAGRRHSRATSAATRAWPLAARALLRPTDRTVSMATPLLFVGAGRFRFIEGVDERAQLATFAGAELAGPDQVRQQRRQRATAQLLGDRP